MAVYVDSMRVCLKNKRWRWNTACHLIADSVGELHEFAKRLGLKRTWFQDKTIPHYDLVTSKRVWAVELGAVEISDKEFVKKINEYRRIKDG